MYFVLVWKWANLNMVVNGNVTVFTTNIFAFADNAYDIMSIFQHYRVIGNVTKNT